jgi:hypothetical protein
LRIYSVRLRTANNKEKKIDAPSLKRHKGFQNECFFNSVPLSLRIAVMAFLRNSFATEESNPENKKMPPLCPQERTPKSSERNHPQSH